MKLDVMYMLTGTPVRMRYTHRWSTSRIQFPENVAEHSWFVSFYSMMITQWYAVNRKMEVHDREFLMAKVLQRSIIHDIEEARTGDIHRPFKYSSDALKESLKKASRIAAEQTFRPLFDDEHWVGLFNVWEQSKDDSLAGLIVRFSDFLAVLAFLHQEGALYGTAHVVSSLCLDTLPSHYDEFKTEEYDFIRPLVDQCDPLVREILGNGCQISSTTNEGDERSH